MNNIIIKIKHCLVDIKLNILGFEGLLYSRVYLENNVSANSVAIFKFLKNIKIN